MKPTQALTGLAATAVIAAFVAHQITAYSLFGNSNGVDERNFALNNSFRDPSANDNHADHINWPGAHGAALAVWKGAAEWNSSAHGTGTGDPHQPNVGDGGANYDFVWLGETTTAPGANRVISTSASSLGTGIFAITRIYTGNAWDMLFDDVQWVWDDGPGTAVTGMDIQGIACHEMGHALGLAHSSVPGATMVATTSGNAVSWRSIETDDQLGVQAIYGASAAAKPRITSVSGSAVIGQQLSVHGAGFDPASNEVWFTPAVPAGQWIAVGPLASSAGGTRIDLTVPGGAGSGAIHVRLPGAQHHALSNPWPLRIGGPICNPDPAGKPRICSVAPLVYQNHASTPQTMDLLGHDFGGASQLAIGGLTLSRFAGEFAVIDDHSIRLEVPTLLECGSLNVTVHGAGGASNPVAIAVNPSNAIWLDGPPTTFTGLTYPLAYGGPPGAGAMVWLSFFPQPSSLPGVVNLAMGNGFTDLYFVAGAVLPACGALELGIPIDGPGIVLSFYLQSIEVTLAGPPFRASNLLVVQKVF